MNSIFYFHKHSLLLLYYEISQLHYKHSVLFNTLQHWWWCQTNGHIGQVTSQVNPVEDQSISTPFNLPVSTEAHDKVLAGEGMRCEIKVPSDIALVIHSSFRQYTVHVDREITTQVHGIEEQIGSTSVNPALALDAHDELLAIGGMTGYIRGTRLACIHHFLFGFLRRMDIYNYNIIRVDQKLMYIPRIQRYVVDRTTLG